MTKAEEQELFRRIAEGETELRHVAVEAFLWLVPVNAARFGHFHREDLEQEGAMALYRAVDGFDYRRGLRFSTYAVHWLRQSFHQYLYNHCSTVRLPVYMHKIMAKVRQGKPTNGLSDRVVETARQLNERHTVTIEHALDLEGPTGNAADKSDFQRTLHRVLSGLPDRERYLIEQHYLHNRTYRELGEEDGVSGERIRQVIQRGLAKLRGQTLRSYL
jgi:RNA polymerase primary sigma factor